MVAVSKGARISGSSRARVPDSVRPLLLLLVIISLLASSLTAMAHVDAPAPAAALAGLPGVDGGDTAPAGDHAGTPAHCDLCSHGFGHVVAALAVGTIDSARGVIDVAGPALPHAATRPDRRDRPPK
jgi:hypothetical protein